MIAKCHNKWADFLWKRHHLREIFVFTPHQALEGTDTKYEGTKLNDYHKLGWIHEKFNAEFPLTSEPHNYFIDQAKTVSTKEQIEIKTTFEESPDEEDDRYKPPNRQLYAIPIKDKHSHEIKPVQEYSLPCMVVPDTNLSSY